MGKLKVELGGKGMPGFQFIYVVQEGLSIHLNRALGIWASLVAQIVKNLPASAGHVGSIPGSGRSPGEGKGNLLQYSCLKNLMDRGTWWAAVHRITESDMTEQLTITY